MCFISAGSITIRCDNKEALLTKHIPSFSYTASSRRDMDVNTELCTMETIPTNMPFQHVQDHLDSDPDFIYEKSKQQVLRNEDIHNPPLHLHPQPVTHVLPHQKVVLHIYKNSI